jgi:hypothetical protein
VLASLVDLFRNHASSLVRGIIPLRKNCHRFSLICVARVSKSCRDHTCYREAVSSFTRVGPLPELPEVRAYESWARDQQYEHQRDLRFGTLDCDSGSWSFQVPQLILSEGIDA